MSLVTSEGNLMQQLDSEGLLRTSHMVGCGQLPQTELHPAALVLVDGRGLELRSQRRCLVPCWSGPCVSTVKEQLVMAGGHQRFCWIQVTEVPKNRAPVLSSFCTVTFLLARSQASNASHHLSVMILPTSRMIKVSLQRPTSISSTSAQVLTA